MTIDEVGLGEIARRQHGVISRTQLRQLGVHRNHVAGKVRRGIWSLPTPQTVAIMAAPDSWRRKLWIGVLSGGEFAAASFHSAAALHHFEGVPQRQIEITVPHPRHLRLAGIRVRQATDLSWPTMIDTRRGLPATSPERTLIDLATLYGRRRIGAMLDGAVLRGDTTAREVGTCLIRLSRPGKRGLTTVAQVLDARRPHDPPPGSVLETELLELIRQAGLDEPRRQFPHPTSTGWPGLVDFAYPDERLLIEVDGRSYHSRLDDIRRDRSRDAEAVAAGWSTMRVDIDDIRLDPAGTVRLIAEALDTRRAHRAATPSRG